MKIHSIYRATNTVNGKVYIGYDSNWPARQYSHKKHSKNPKYKFHLAIQKYGWDSFEWEIIYQSLDGIHCKEVMEDRFIVDHDSINSGYNMKAGGSGGWNSVNSKRKEQFDNGEVTWNSKGLLYYNDGVRTYRLTHDDPRRNTLSPGRVESDSATSRGSTHWFKDGQEVMAKECPGEGWLPGRPSVSERARIRYDLTPKSCHVCGDPIPFERRGTKSCSKNCADNRRLEVARRPRNRVSTNLTVE